MSRTVPGASGRRATRGVLPARYPHSDEPGRGADVIPASRMCHVSRTDRAKVVQGSRVAGADRNILRQCALLWFGGGTDAPRAADLAVTVQHGVAASRRFDRTAGIAAVQTFRYSGDQRIRRIAPFRSLPNCCSGRLKSALVGTRRHGSRRIASAPTPLDGKAKP